MSDRSLRRKRADDVFDRISGLILSGEFAPGEAMPSERELMERFDVGRPAVREAVQRLANMGIATVSHGERSRVNPLSPALALRQMDGVAQLLLSADPSTLDHLRDARRMVETGLVSLAAEKASDEDVAALGTILGRQKRAIGDREAFVSEDIAFHLRIAEIARNPVVTATHDALLGWILKRHSHLLHWQGRERDTLREHHRIVGAIARGEPSLAADRMAFHLDRAAERQGGDKPLDAPS